MLPREPEEIECRLEPEEGAVARAGRMALERIELPAAEGAGVPAVVVPERRRRRRGTVGVIWRRRRLVLVVTTIAVLAGAAWVWRRPIVYRSSVRLEVRGDGLAKVEEEMIRAGVKVSADDRGGVIVSMDADSPQRAEGIARVVAGAYVARNAEERGGRRRELAEIERRRGELEREQGPIDLARGDGVPQTLGKQIDAVNAALSAARVEAGEAKGISEESSGAAGAESAVSAGDEATLRGELAKARQRLVEARGQYLPNHPAVKSAEATVEGLAAAHAAAARKRWAGAESRVGQLETELARRQGAAREISELAARYRAAAAPVVEVSIAGDGPYTRAASPSKVVVVLAALAAGLMAGGLVSLADRKPRSAGEVSEGLDLPLLAVVPRMKGRFVRPWARGLAAHNDPHSAVGAACREVRRAVYFGVPREQARTIVLASPSCGEGASTVAANLATVMAGEGASVVVVDANLRRPVMHRIFGVDGERGLSAVLAGRLPLEAGVQATVVKGVDVLPCGPLPANPAEVLNSRAMAEVLWALAGRYEHVLVDCPAASAGADAAVLGAMCDLTILVARPGRATGKWIAAVRDEMGAVGARVLGVVVNGAKEAQRSGREVERDVAPVPARLQLTGAAAGTGRAEGPGRNPIEVIAELRGRRKWWRKSRWRR